MGEWTLLLVGSWRFKSQSGKSSSEAVYGIGMIGAWVYYIGAANGFWEGVMGFLKGLVWPGFVVHGLLKYLSL